MNNAVKINRASIQAADRRRNTRHVGPNVRTLTFYIVLPDDGTFSDREWVEKFIAGQIEDATKNAAAELAKEVCG